MSSDRNLSLIFLFAVTLFISAVLMFAVQPMFGKLLLPLLGGSPSVWNTCMVFYQTLLFGGYAYAHYLSQKLPSQKQTWVHAAVVIVSLLALPVGLPEELQPPAESDPTFWLMWVLLLSIGLPYFVVSTTSTLLQKWFSGIGHHTSHDPYYLYAASNAGSMLSLLSYPFLIEPYLGLAEQQMIWSAGYGLLCLCVGFCAWVFWRQGQSLSPVDELPEVDSTLPLNVKLHWMALAFVPSSLLLGLTNFISTDVAAVPLLWIVPLTLYLFSFILVFGTWADRIHPWMIQAQPVVLLPFLAYAFVDPAALPFTLNLVLHLLAFFLAVMVCHGELARQRPHTRHLTTFYLIMSFAGMLGGMFNTFVAPFVFEGVYEYPMMIIAALLLRPGLDVARWYRQLLFPAAVLLVAIGWYGLSDHLSQALVYSVTNGLILLSGVVYAVRKQPVTLASLSGVILLLALGMRGLMSQTVFQERSFFGVLSVRESVLLNEQQRPEKYHELFHGTTKHGAQRLAAGFKTTPLTYYSRPGPMGQLFKTFDFKNDAWRIGSVGLGAGALACYAKPEQHWTFYEIDPLVVETARDSGYFSYLKTCTPQADYSIGDARLSLQNSNEQFDLLIMDAFSSDSVPTHLLTREAFALYLSRLKPGGLLAFHITNRHLQLKKVIANHVQAMGIAALIQEFKPQDDIPLVTATDWVVIAQNESTLQPLADSRLGYWQKLPLYFDMKPWTDDFTNIIGIWKNL